MELRARRVEFDSQKNTLVAEGKPQLVQKGDEVDGQLMTYDLDKRVGTIYQATTTYEKGLYHGKEIRKASENELDVLGGAYSTCDLDPPHYHFQARYMKIYLKDKMVAKPVVFYLRNVPVLFAAVLRVPDQTGPALGVPVPAVRIRVQQHDRAIHPQRRLLLGPERLHGLERRRRLLPAAAGMGAAHRGQLQAAVQFRGPRRGPFRTQRPDPDRRLHAVRHALADHRPAYAHVGARQFRLQPRVQRQLAVRAILRGSREPLPDLERPAHALRRLGLTERGRRAPSGLSTRRRASRIPTGKVRCTGRRWARWPRPRA